MSLPLRPTCGGHLPFALCKHGADDSDMTVDGRLFRGFPMWFGYFQPRLAVGAEFAGAFGEEASADLAGVTLGGLEIGIPLASTMGGDEAIALHVGRMTARPAGSCPCGQASPGRVSTTAGRAPGKRKGRPDRPPFAFACTGIPRISASRTRPPGSVPSSPDRALRRASARGRRSPCRPRRRHSRGSHARAGSALRR